MVKAPAFHPPFLTTYMKSLSLERSHMRKFDLQRAPFLNIMGATGYRLRAIYQPTLSINNRENSLLSLRHTRWSVLFGQVGIHQDPIKDLQESNFLQVSSGGRSPEYSTRPHLYMVNWQSLTSRSHHKERREFGPEGNITIPTSCQDQTLPVSYLLVDSS